MATKRQLIYDADFELYMLCCAMQQDCGFPAINPETQEPYDDTETTSVPWADPEDVFNALVKRAEALKTQLKATEIVFVFSGKSNFRKELWDGYKTSRSAGKPPAYWATIRMLKADGRYQVLSEDCLEGDDYIGILMTRPSSVDRIAVMTDKDVLTLPNIKVWRNEAIQTTTEDSAEVYHLTQTLTGDSTDGYKGCPGFGPKSAPELLAKPGDRWTNVVLAYEKAWAADQKAKAKAELEGKAHVSKFVTGSPEAEALLNARLARILRFEDWDPKARRPILWHPDPQARQTFHAPGDDHATA